jgi:hypothetical protein
MCEKDPVSHNFVRLYFLFFVRLHSQSQVFNSPNQTMNWGQTSEPMFVFTAGNVFFKEQITAGNVDSTKYAARKLLIA